MKKPLSNNKCIVSEPGAAFVSFCSVSKKLFILLIILVSSVSIQAQAIVELNSYFEQRRASGNSLMVNEAAHLESLVNDVLPTIYIGNTIISNGETQPLCVNLKAGSVDRIRSVNPLFRKVELITIQLTSPADLNFILDLPNLSGFANLKYIYFLCELRIGAEDLEKLFLPKNGIAVFYKVSIPN